MHQRPLAPKLSIRKEIESLWIFQPAITEDCRLCRPHVSIRLRWMLLWTCVVFTFSATIGRKTAVKTCNRRGIRSVVSYTGCFMNTCKCRGAFFFFWSHSQSDMLSEYGWSRSCGCFKLKNYQHVIILKSLFPTFCTIGFTVPMCFDCKLQPSSGRHKCWSHVQRDIQSVKHKGVICLFILLPFQIYTVLLTFIKILTQVKYQNYVRCSIQTSCERICLQFKVERRSQVYILGVYTMSECTVLLLLLMYCFILTLKSSDFLHTVHL